MKNLFDLYFIDVKVKDIKTNSKEVSKEDAFICIKGVNVDRHEYISEAIKMVLLLLWYQKVKIIKYLI